jgi:hypothetical protein
MKNPFVVGVMTRTQLARLYKVSLPTMMKWAKPILEKFNFRGRILTTKIVRHIFDHLGNPEIG